MEIRRLFFMLLVFLLVTMPMCACNSVYGSRRCDHKCLTAQSPLQQPPLAYSDVGVLRRLFERLNAGSLINSYFSAYDCGKYGRMLSCNCSITNTSSQCRATFLDLSDKRIGGSIPDDIGNLVYLKSLDLSGNMLRGVIPKSLANLTNLQYLDLCKNQLEGPIPSFLRELKNLQELSPISLAGAKACRFGENSSLNLIRYLCDNWFNGSIPHELGELTSIKVLFLENNLLSGKIPKQLGQITTLWRWALNDNKFTGKLPDELGNLKNLEELYMMNNEFSGILPSGFKQWKKLRYLMVRGNNLSGRFPDLSSLQQLYTLSLTGNYFVGPFPNMPSNLTILTVTNLLMEGDYGNRFPDLTSVVNLRDLTLRNCSIIGQIPDYIWHLRKLNYLDLSLNNFSGRIPPSISHNSLNTIFLQSNKINQYLPMWLINQSIPNVDVSDNFFTIESLPTKNISKTLNLFACCSNIANMTQKWLEAGFHCSNEKSKYDSLYINCGGDLALINGSNTYEADLQPDGESTSYISPSGRWAYSSMGFYSYTGVNQYIYNKTCNMSMVDSVLYQSARVAPLSLKYYGLCLKNDDYIVKLHFAEVGWDADQAFGLKNRRIFDVRIQGKLVLSDFNIEAEAGGVGLNITKEFTAIVNDSRLEIHLSSNGKGSSQYPTTTNYGPLISAISVFPVRRKHDTLSSSAKVGIGVSSALFFILILVLLERFCLFGRKKKNGQGIELSPGRVFSFKQIKAATNEFDEKNRLGEGGFGSVYKGLLEDGKLEIAVKKLSAGSQQGSNEFLNEIRIISTLQHPNLVKLMGCCVENNTLLLVYEFMENNSLGHALFGPDQDLRSKLDWLTRYNICLDVAKGLAYLHESTFSIIHGDIKPTNILLDKNLNAKISDFGFAELYDEKKTQCPQCIKRVKGTLLYMAPEYATEGHLTPKADVYSFGIVMLEIITGKQSSFQRNNETEYLKNKAYVAEAENKLLELIDRNIKPSSKKAQIFFNLAMSCINPSHDLRPTMSEVVKILEGNRKIKNTSTSSPLIENFAIDKDEISHSQSTFSGSSSQPGGSSATFSASASKEIEQSGLDVDNSDKTIINVGEISTDESLLSAKTDQHTE